MFDHPKVCHAFMLGLVPGVAKALIASDCMNFLNAYRLLLYICRHLFNLKLLLLQAAAHPGFKPGLEHD